MGIFRGSYAEGFAPRDFAPRFPSLWQGCAGAWCPGLGPSGLTLRDWSGRRQDGTLTSLASATAWPQPITGRQMLSTDGTGYVDCGTVPNFNGANKLSLSGWLYRSATNISVGFGGAAGPTSTDLNLFSILWNATDGYLYQWCAAGSLAYAYVLLGAITGRHHVAMVYDGTQATDATRLKVFWDGIQQTLTIGATIPAAVGNVSPFIIGKDRSNDLCAGSYDDVRLYLCPLNANEVALLARYPGIAYEYERKSKLMTSMKSTGSPRQAMHLQRQRVA